MRQMLLQNAIVILLQNATEVYYKMRRVFYYKMRRLLQIATVQCPCVDEINWNKIPSEAVLMFLHVAFAEMKLCSSQKR